MTRSISNLLNLLSLEPDDLLTVTGGGGKTSLLFRLAEEMTSKGHKSLITTTTKMAYPQHFNGKIHFLENKNPEIFLESLSKTSAPRIFAAAGPIPGGKVRGLEKSMVDHIHNNCPKRLILNEGDGSAGYPAKVYRPHEPVIPSSTTRLVHLIGCEGWNRPLRESVHRCPTEMGDQLMDASWLKDYFTLFLAAVEKDPHPAPWLMINKAEGVHYEAAQKIAVIGSSYFSNIMIASFKEGWCEPWSPDLS